LARHRRVFRRLDRRRASTLTYRRAALDASIASQPAPAALPDAAAADGTRQGLYKCGPNDQKMPGFETTEKVFTVKDSRISGQVRWKPAADGAAGWESFSGLIGDDGRAVIVGYGIDDKGAGYPIYHYGTLANGHLTAAGKEGSRACTLDYLRAPAP